MKKSRITKLALSGAAVAALAATFSTSTYAWYVSNKTANVNAVTGSTATGDSDKSISLSVTGEKGTFKKSITLQLNAGYTGTGLTPLSRATGGATPTYTSLTQNDPAKTATASEAYSGAGYYVYTFYVLAQEYCTITPRLTIENTTGTLPDQVNYATTAVGGVASGDTFSVDARDAMCVSQYFSRGSWVASGENAGQFNATPDNDDAYVGFVLADGTSLDGYYTNTACTEAATGTADGTSTYYKKAAVTGDSAGNVGASHLVKGTDQAVTLPADSQYVTGDAQAYYNAITGYTLTADSSATTGDAVNMFTTSNSLTDISSITLMAGVPYKLVYHLWLDGAADKCFNCAAGQTISVAFDYTVAA